MTRRTLSLGMMGAIAATAMVLAPVAANARYQGGYQQARDHDGGWGQEGRGGYERRGGHGDRDGYAGNGPDGRRDYDGRRHRCDRGTGGTIIGAIAGGLLGNAVAGYGDRAAGTIIGGGVGALAGNAIARDC